MQLLQQVAALVDVASRPENARRLAQSMGAADLLLFLADPDFSTLLPAPGFPQVLPSGRQWLRYIEQCATAPQSAKLISPYTSQEVEAHGTVLSDGSVIVCLGGPPETSAWQQVCALMPLIAATARAETRSSVAVANAALAQDKTRQAEHLAQALADARKRLEAGLRDRERLLAERIAGEERLKLAQETAHMGVWEWDIKSGRLDLSEEVLRIYGISEGAFDGTFAGLEKIYAAEDRERLQQVLQEALAGSRDYDVEFKLVWPGERVHWIASRGQVLRDPSGQPVSMVGFSLDITSRKMAEEALRKSEKLAVTGRLAATLAHEINNPLEGVVNLVFLAKGETSPEEIRKYLTLAEHELERITHITRQTLGFYREKISPAPVNVAQVISEVLPIYEKGIERKAINLEQRLDQHAEIFAIAGEIRQVISNLLVNALDAAPQGGSILIRVAQRGGKVRIAMGDNGSGISQNNRPFLFEPFFTTKKDIGTGLGLWITKEIVEKHGGQIKIRSRSDEGCSGTVVSIVFPGVPAAAAEETSGGGR